MADGGGESFWSWGCSLLPPRTRTFSLKFAFSVDVVDGSKAVHYSPLLYTVSTVGGKKNIVYAADVKELGCN